MNRAQIRNKIEKYEARRDAYLAEGRPVSAEMEDRVVKGLKKKLEEVIGGSPKD